MISCGHLLDGGPHYVFTSLLMSETVTSVSNLRLLFLGDVFGEPGRRAVMEKIPEFKERWKIDFIVVNGENSAAGRGITPKIAIGLLRAGATVITLGDHAWDQSEIIEYMATEPRLLRPFNYPAGVPGQGSVILETAKGKVAILNLMARSFMNQPLDNPFNLGLAEVERLRAETPMIMVDFHGETTSEKNAMGYWLDGKVSAVFGTHTHVQTADDRILPQGTAYLTDAGMCGPRQSVIGSDPASILQRFSTNLPTRNHVGKGDVQVCGVWVEIEPATGRAVHIERIFEVIPQVS
jgi:2',3'-cyclic-nucleotide 2'-phosphodiesterase